LSEFIIKPRNSRDCVGAMIVYSIFIMKPGHCRRYYYYSVVQNVLFEQVQSHITSMASMIL
jgi:hypothetical protein